MNSTCTSESNKELKCFKILMNFLKQQQQKVKMYAIQFMHTHTYVYIYECMRIYTHTYMRGKEEIQHLSSTLKVLRMPIFTCKTAKCFRS